MTFSNQTYFFVLCFISIFLHGIFNKYFADLRTTKIIVLITNYLLIGLLIILKTPKNDVIKYGLLCGVTLYASLQLSSLFSYILIGGSKYIEDPEVMLMLGFIIVSIITSFLVLIGHFINYLREKN
jgi:hypothetical protein